MITGLAAPAAASAAGTVEQEAGTNAVRVRAEAGKRDHVTLTRAGTELVVAYDATAGTGTFAAGAGCADVGASVRCPAATAVSLLLDDEADRLSASGLGIPVTAGGGPGDDVLGGGAAADLLVGDAGNDILDAGPGGDDLLGGDGDDILRARDGEADSLGCGAGDDEATIDAVDLVGNCERGPDADGDGFQEGLDCDDANVDFSPGAPDFTDDGIDQNCDGRDARNLDRDGDGFKIPDDCNDTTRAIKPNAPEIRGNDVDENCDGREATIGVFSISLANQWVPGARTTLLKSLVLRGAPKGVNITVRCSGRRGSGCPPRGKRFKVPRANDGVDLRQPFRGRRLRTGSKVTVTVSDPQFVTLRITFTIVPFDLPLRTDRCQKPDAERSRPC